MNKTALAVVLSLALVGPAIAGPTSAAAHDWDYELVLIVETGEHGKHTATLAGPALSGPILLRGDECAMAMLAIERAGGSAACVPAGTADLIHNNN
jgi:hypothetical protein